MRVFLTAKMPRKTHNTLWLPTLLALVVGLAAVSRESLWIDEAHSVYWAAQPTLPDLWRSLHEVFSDVQMTVYATQLWAWEKIVPHGEWPLRFNNVLWLAVALMAWAHAVPRRLRAAALALVALSPFVWAYVSETRPYLMVFAGSSLMACGLARCLAGTVTPGWLWSAAAGGVIAMGASSAALPWVGICLLAVVGLAWREVRQLSWPGMAALVLAAAAISALDVMVFTSGGKVVSPAGTTAATVAFIPYELYGFLGLGPSRDELRTALGPSLARDLPALLILAMAFATVMAAGFLEFIRRVGTRAALGWTALLAIPAATVVALGSSSGLRTTGRHLTPMLAFSLPLILLGVDRLWRLKTRWARLAVAALFIGWSVSALEVRFAARHQKDDYRAAAALALGALNAGERVWWAADDCGAGYYGLPVAPKEEPGKARWVVNWSEPPASTDLPPLVITTRPDIYDAGRVLERQLAPRYTPDRSLAGFVVWRRAPEGGEASTAHPTKSSTQRK